MVILDIDSMITEEHLLRRIKNCVNFDCIYEKAAPYYSYVGRKSIAPVVLIKMLLMVHSFRPMYHGTAAMRQLKRSNVPL